MNDNDQSGPSGSFLQQFFTTLMAILSSNWFQAAGQISQFVRWLFHSRPQGIYEILDYDVTLDIQDALGQVAILRRRQKVRFLQDHVIAYEDEAWGDGNPLATYHCSPGFPVESFPARCPRHHSYLPAPDQESRRYRGIQHRADRQRRLYQC